MTTKRYFPHISAALVSTLLFAACSTDEIATGSTRDADGNYIYTMHLDGAAPSFDATRATTAWANGSVVYLQFEGRDGLNTASGTATYNSSDGNWTLKTNSSLRITGNGEELPLTAIYVDDKRSVEGTIIKTTPQSCFYDDSDGSYTHPTATDIYVKAMLKPSFWRFHFRGTPNQKVTISNANSDFLFLSGFDYASSEPFFSQEDVSLTVGSNGRTPYVYTFFENEDKDNALTVTTADGTYKRIVKPEDLSVGKSIYCQLPTSANYESAGWTTTTDPASTPSTKVDKEQLPFGNYGGSETFTITSNTSWTVSVPSTDTGWLSVNYTSGNGNRTITVTAKANESATGRTSFVSVNSEGTTIKIPVVQPGATPTLAVNGKTAVTLTLKADGETQTISITSNDSWIITSSESWCTLSITNGTGNGSCNITVSKNETSNQRTATVTAISNTDSSKRAIVTIEQSAPTAPTPTPGVDGTYTIPGTDVTFKMIPVDGGTFQMGAALGAGSTANPNEGPIRNVTVGSFNIGETEVSQALWKAVMGKNPANFQKDNAPVEYVSYDDICGTNGQGTDTKCFLYKLNNLLAGQLGGKKFQLPTEAEWEFAAHGGNKSRGYKYAGGNTLKDVGWYKDNSSSRTHPSKEKAANELGLYDMSGNVREWCKDWYVDNYDRNQTNNPTGPATGEKRVVRGGCILSPDTDCRVTFREAFTPSTKYINLGFRLVLK